MYKQVLKKSSQATYTELTVAILMFQVLTPIFLLLPSENVHFSVTDILPQNDSAFSIVTGPVMGFTSQHTAINFLYNTLYNCANLHFS